MVHSNNNSCVPYLCCGPSTAYHHNKNAARKIINHFDSSFSTRFVDINLLFWKWYAWKGSIFGEYHTMEMLNASRPLLDASIYFSHSYLVFVETNRQMRMESKRSHAWKFSANSGNSKVWKVVNSYLGMSAFSFRLRNEGIFSLRPFASKFIHSVIELNARHTHTHTGTLLLFRSLSRVHCANMSERISEWNENAETDHQQKSNKTESTYENVATNSI